MHILHLGNAVFTSIDLKKNKLKQFEERPFKSVLLKMKNNNKDTGVNLEGSKLFK